ncbi:MAG TPA: hypothetical protein VEJ87_05315 [Acidimicrobiales bacterium]|nr:hypothetical protein [Acidimicrobiales bacterium]
MTTSLPENAVNAEVDAELPSAKLFDEVVNQTEAVRQLRAAIRKPVHAYLFAGRSDLGAPELARGFAAGLLCPNGGCGECDSCRRALLGIHPDLIEVQRSGANLSVEDARNVVRLAQRRPLEAGRQVIVIGDIDQARLAAPVLLKTLEEPPGPTVFVLLSDTVPSDIATVTSRCVRIELSPVPSSELVDWLVSLGVDDAVASEVASAAGGSPLRARLLAEDPDLAARHALWRSVPARLDGTGSSAAALASELLQSAEQAVQPLRARHRAELEEMAGAAEASGEKGVPKSVEERHRREERRWRTDELRSGLATLATEYRDRIAAQSGAAGNQLAPSEALRSGERIKRLSKAVSDIEELSFELIRNPNETLQLEALLVRLSSVPG